MKDVLQKRAETDANNAYSALTEEANKFLYDQNGVFSRQGTNAANSVSDTRDFYEKAAARHGKGLNDAAARMFTARADQSRMYEARKGQFGSSTPEVRQAVAARLDRERDELLAARQEKAGAAAGAQAPEQAPDQARGQTPGQTEPGASPASGKPGYEKNQDPQSIDDLISPAGRNVLVNTAQSEAQKQQKAAQEVAVNQVYNSIREQTKGMGKEQAFAFFSEVTADAPPELQAELFKKYKADESESQGRQLPPELRNGV